MSLAGVWENAYGSKMTLGLVNPNLIMGEYTSTTGSSGTYKVIGYQTNADPTAKAGQAATLAIDWHSVVAGPPDNSWHWVSGLSGQLSIEQGQEQLILAHALVASVEFPGLAPAGTYIDKLIYTRTSREAPKSLKAPDGAEVAADDPMVGSWFAPDGTSLLIQSVSPYPGNAFGWILGKLIWRGGPSMLYGVTDINARSSGLQLQSASLVGLPSDAGGPALSYSGTLNLSSGQLTVTVLQSNSTASNATYVQTALSCLTFTKR